MPASYSRAQHVTKISPFGSIFLRLNPSISTNLCISLRIEPVLLKSHLFGSGFDNHQFSCFKIGYAQSIHV